jgi:23S rRNA G2069 N7-methylase RlmK/C1962 C5-methylase RlmI
MSVLDDCFRGTGTDADQFRLLVLDVLERLPLIRERSPQVGDEVAKLEEVLRDFLAYAYGDRSNPSAQQQVQEEERHRQPAEMRKRERARPRTAAPEGGDEAQDKSEYK